MLTYPAALNVSNVNLVCPETRCVRPSLRPCLGVPCIYAWCLVGAPVRPSVFWV